MLNGLPFCLEEDSIQGLPIAPGHRLLDCITGKVNVIIFYKISQPSFNSFLADISRGVRKQAYLVAYVSRLISWRTQADLSLGVRKQAYLVAYVSRHLVAYASRLISWGTQADLSRGVRKQDYLVAYVSRLI